MNTMIINQQEIMVKEWNGERVISLPDIDKIHGRVKGTARQRFRSNYKKFTEKVDYYEVTRREMQDELQLGTIKGNPNITMHLLTERGYLLLVKVMDDDRAWEVQSKLVDLYFHVKKKVQDPSNKSMIVPSTNMEIQTRSDMEMIRFFFEEQNKILEQERQRNEEMRKTLLDSFQMLARVCVNITQENKNLTQMLSHNIPESLVEQATKEEVSQKNDLPEVKNEKSEIRTIVYKKCQEIHNLDNEHYTSTKAVLDKACKLLTQEYGICWDQEKKEYIAENGTANKYITRLDVYEWMCKRKKNCVKLLESKLDSMQKTAEKHLEKNVVFPVSNTKQMRDLAVFVTRKRGIYSPNGASLFQKFFKYLDERYPVKWDNLKEKYKKTHGMTSSERVSNLSIIAEYPHIQRYCIQYFNEYIQKNYSDMLEK